jgi:predicted nuclease of predicted toxin-antitoxin system
MKLLFDQNISFRITKKLQSYFVGCLHVSDCKLNDCEDPEIWKYARDNNFAIVTFDSDFYDISIINGHPPKIIWIRTGNLTTKQIVQLMIDNQKTIDSFLEDYEFDEQSCLELES